VSLLVLVLVFRRKPSAAESKQTNFALTKGPKSGPGPPTHLHVDGMCVKKCDICVVVRVNTPRHIVSGLLRLTVVERFSS